MTHRQTSLLLLICSATFGCGDDGNTNPELGTDPFGNYDEGNVTAIGVEGGAAGDGADLPAGTIGPDGTVVSDSSIAVATSPSGSGCVELGDGLCVDVAAQGGKFCDQAEGPADVIVIDGEVVDIICYPPADDPDRPVEEITLATEGAVEVVQNANSTTIVFSEATDGMPIEADISVDGNKVALYGNGPDKTIIDGDVILDGNNPRVRGVTILGNLIIKKNSGAVVFSVIHGNIELQDTASNNNVFVENDVYGSVTVPSNNNIFSGNNVQGDWNVTGSGNICDENFAFSDENEDFVIDSTEFGDALDCLP